MANVKYVGGVWLPAHESHLIEWMQQKNEVVDGKLTYQHHKLLAAMEWVHRFGVAVDVGAHCGLWSAHLAKRFQAVHAFEPVALHRECFHLNVPASNVHLHECALGEQEGRVAIHTTAGSSGDSWVDGDGDIPLVRFDDLEPLNVDFVKLDCEGYELFALRGMEETLKRCHPTVIVEQKPGRAQKFGLAETEAVDYLRGLGAFLRRTMSGDFIMAWDKP